MKQTKNTRLFMVGFAIAALAVVAWEATPKSTTSAPTASEDGVAGAAASFLSLLEGDALDRATYDLGDEEQFNWAFTPVSRNGLPLKDMTLEQRSAAHAMLQATLSSQDTTRPTRSSSWNASSASSRAARNGAIPRTTTSPSSARRVRAGPGRGASRATTCRSTSPRRRTS